MLRQVGLIILSGCMVLTSWVVRPQTARALEVQCIEASKYKHLYLIFGNDRRKLAQYLRLNEANLPDAEACRALFVSGPMEPRARSRELGQPSDSDKLLQAIAENRGWLVTIYLASGGGNIGTGLIIAEITRMFWLKSEAPDHPGFTYWPDFIMRPAVKSGRGEPELTDAVVPPESSRKVGRTMSVQSAVLRSRPSPAGEGAARQPAHSHMYPQSSGEGLFLSIAGGPRHRLRTTSRCKSFSSNCTDPRTGSLRFIAPWMEERNS